MDNNTQQITEVNGEIVITQLPSVDILKNEFIASLAKDIFYTRDLNRQTAKSLSEDAIYCAKTFFNSLVKNKIITIDDNNIIKYK